MSGSKSANMPGRPLNVSQFKLPNEYMRPCCTGIIIGDCNENVMRKFSECDLIFFVRYLPIVSYLCDRLDRW